jgi:hypothetical protein
VVVRILDEANIPYVGESVQFMVLSDRNRDIAIPSD